MNRFAKLMWEQVAADGRRLPATARRRFQQPRIPHGVVNLDDMRALARRRLPRVVFDFVDGGAADELAVVRNRTDFRSLVFSPRMLVDVEKVELRTTVLGQPLSFPVIGAPTGVAGLVHPAGELGLARAMRAAGSVYTLATSSSYGIGEVAAVTPESLWFQLYIWRDREFVRRVLGQAAEHGCRALVVTVDGARTGRRERDLRNRFSRPPRVGLRTLASGLAHPRWSYGFVRHGRFLPANFDVGGTAVAHAEAFARSFDPSATWADLEWIRRCWDGPLAVKGIMRPDDARRAVDAGAQAVVVSNHGGRQLDDVPSSISALPSVVDAVGSRCEVLLDSGVRRGSDVVKALALGARACLVGRPLLFGLGAAGEAGVARVLDLLREEIELTLALIGCQGVDELDRGYLTGGFG